MTFQKRYNHYIDAWLTQEKHLILHPISGEKNIDQCRYHNTTYRQFGTAVAFVAAAYIAIALALAAIAVCLKDGSGDIAVVSASDS